MRSFVVFNVLNRLFGINIECVKRILPSQFLTTIPDADEHIEGMFEYEDEIIKVLSFREAIGEKSYEDELIEFFPKLKSQHVDWVDALKDSLREGTPFTRTTNPHACDLGKWIDSFHPDDKDILAAMKQLDHHHQLLHRSAVDLLGTCNDAQMTQCEEETEDQIDTLFNNTLKELLNVSSMSDKVAASLQRCLILLGKDGESFGVNIDSVEDILHVEEDELHMVKEVQTMGDFINVEAILEHEDKLITIVKDIRINRRSE